jgi:hypothetical protein
VNKSSLGKFLYALRPAKNIERKMFCEVFARLSRIAPLSTYRYIGFGSNECCDFRLFHERLGIKDMLNIEKRIDAKARVEFNRPYSCIRMEWGLSHDILPTLDWPRRAIVWLDYDLPLDPSILRDIALVAGTAKSGSVLLVTVEVEPGDPSGGNAVNKRLDGLKARVGKDKVPSTVEARDLFKWGMANVCREIVHNEILETLDARCAPFPPDDSIRYDQLFNFRYADGRRMLTVGGIFLDGKDQKKMSSKRHFKDLGFVRFDAKAYVIETPVLTLREMHYLDRHLPHSATSPKWLPEEERKRYRKVYRYYPNFTEVEA